MKTLITGAGGFIGQELALALLNDASFSEIVLTDLVEPPIPDIALEQEITLRSVSADLTSADVRQRDFSILQRSTASTFFMASCPVLRRLTWTSA